ncbi:MAG: hypothetical protein O3A47_08710, partial [Chloroflexi bacterium]|nr:hypothetical protein [Chloroflexota bacterium]
MREMTEEVAVETSIGLPSVSRRVAVLRGLAIPGLVAVASLAVAVAGALLVGDQSGVDGVNGFVETLSGSSSSFLGDLGILAPLGFAFVAGAVAAVNPCGFAMLPAYMGLYLGTNNEDGSAEGPLRQATRALVVGVAVTAGFVVLFGLAGSVIALGARSAVADILPWLGLAIGVILAIGGAWLVGGGKLYTAFAARAAARVGDPGRVSVRGYFLFGLSYGTASLSCTLPIFLSVVGTTFAVSSIGTFLGQFVLYALGMGTVIMALTIGMAVFKGAMVGGLRKAMPYVEPVGSWLMVV